MYTFPPPSLFSLSPSIPGTNTPPSYLTVIVNGISGPLHCNMQYSRELEQDPLQY